MTAPEQKPVPENQPWSIRGVETLLERHPSLSNRWRYEQGTALLAVQRVYERTSEMRYFEYIRRNIDDFVDVDGNIRTYTAEEYSLDQVNPGKLLFLLYELTGDRRYKEAAFLLRRQLLTQPRNEEGGLWHKLIYPHQMWLDGLYMAGPFMAQFAHTFGEPGLFDDIACQVELFDRHNRQPDSGLLCHGWDCSRSQKWADPQSGRSPISWGRAMGWFMMALADMLDFFPPEHPQRDPIVQVFRHTTQAALADQDEASGVWHQVLDQPGRPGNYLEASASCMFVYAILKGVRQGHLDLGCLQPARRAYQGILDRFVEVNDRGWVNLHHICSVAGLGGNPYRDGSFQYYISEPIVSNDYKGFGPFIMASVEIEHIHENSSDQS